MRNWAWPQPRRKRELNTTPVRWGMAAVLVGGGGAGGICRGAGGRWRGLAGLRGDAPSNISDQAPLVWRAPERPVGLAAVPVGGSGARPG